MNGREIWSQKHQAISQYKPKSDQSQRTSYNFSITLPSATLCDGGWSGLLQANLSGLSVTLSNVIFDAVHDLQDQVNNISYSKGLFDWLPWGLGPLLRDSFIIIIVIGFWILGCALCTCVRSSLSVRMVSYG